MVEVDMYPIQLPYCVTKIYEHKQIKKKILKEIAKLDDSGNESITKYDYPNKQSYKRKYAIIMSEIFSKYMDSIAKSMQYKKYKIQNIWYQQYEKGDTHIWHVHENCMFANVYFLELPDSNCATEFYNPFTNKIMKNDYIKEGDLLTFPSVIQHRSPVNDSEERKTIISFNSNFSV